MTAYCQHCQDEFSPVEYSDGEFCSYECEEAHNNDAENLAAYESARYGGSSPLN